MRHAPRPRIARLSLAAVLGAALLASVLPGQASAARKFLTIGTAGERGAYFPEGGSICRFVQMRHREHGITCSVTPTGGSIFNLDALRENEIDLGFAQSDQQYDAWHGAGAFARTGGNKELRSLFSLHSEALTILARKGLEARSLEDLKSRRVHLGNRGSGTRATMEELLRARGWEENVFASVEEMRAGELGARLCAGEIDAFAFATGHPSGTTEEVATDCGARLINISGPAIERMMAEHSYYVPAVIPGGMYRNNPFDVQTFGVLATVVTSRSVDDETVYQVVKSVFENFEDFKTTHPILSTLDRKRMISEGLTAPLHDGARRYYREAGLLEE